MIKRQGFIIEGTTCQSCENIIIRQAKKVKGVKEVVFNYRSEKGHVKYDTDLTDIDEILFKIEEKGYIRRDPSKPRAIEILDETFNSSKREMVNVPIVGTITAGEPILAVENIEDYFPIPTDYMPNETSFMLSGFSKRSDRTSEYSFPVAVLMISLMRL